MVRLSIIANMAAVVRSLNLSTVISDTCTGESPHNL